MQIKIKENSWMARQAAKRLRSNRVAFVFHKTIHLWGTSKSEFLQNLSWVRHEVAHIKQYKKYGTARFISLYLYHTALSGYYNNRFEAEARGREDDDGILQDVEFL